MLDFLHSNKQKFEENCSGRPACSGQRSAGFYLIKSEILLPILGATKPHFLQFLFISGFIITRTVFINIEKMKTAAKLPLKYGFGEGF